MRVEWDENRCALSALFAGLAPEVFSVDEGGGLAIGTEFGDELLQAVHDAADSCPMQAITVTD